MKKIILSFIISILLGSSIQAQTKPCKEVIAYYCDWLASSLPVNNIDFSRYTVINFAFFQPMSDGSIEEGDAGVDSQLLNSLVSSAHSKGVKVMISIGGWTWSDNFPGIAASSTSRAKFASECARLINTYKVDGVDIDWEYPGYTDHSGTSADKANFTLFMTAIRNAIDPIAGTQLLSACFGAADERMQNIEWDKIVPVIDMINLMTYDFFGDWDMIANHNSPLYAPAQGDPSFNVNSAFKGLTTKYNVPPAKVNIGAAFYGHAQAGVTALFGASTGADIQTFPNDDGSPTYNEILAKKSLYTEYWDSNAQVPYLLGKNGFNSFVSYDNESSITLKGEYVVNNNARGVIIWEISGDYASGGPVLATALAKGLCSNPNAVNEQESQQDAIFYPSPTNGFVSVRITNGHDKNQVSVFNGQGQLVLSRHFDQNEFSLNLKELENGIYFVNIVNDKGNVTKKIIKE